MKSCPSGEIYRKSYTRKGTGRKGTGRKGTGRTRVQGKCIHNVGAPGKGGPGIGRLRKGDLAKYGYKNVISMPVGARHASLTKAVAEFGSLGVWRKLNAVSVYTRRTSPGASAVFKADMDWIRNKFGIKAF